MISVKTIESAPKVENPHGIDAKRLYDHPSAQVMHIRLEPGQAIAKHSAPVDVCFYVLQGQAEFELDDETISVGPDTLIESPANGLHRIVNNGEETVRVLVVKAPRL